MLHFSLENQICKHDILEGKIISLILRFETEIIISRISTCYQDNHSYLIIPVTKPANFLWSWSKLLDERGVDTDVGVVDCKEPLDPYRVFKSIMRSELAVPVEFDPWKFWK